MTLPESVHGALLIGGTRAPNWIAGPARRGKPSSLYSKAGPLRL